MKRRNYWTWKTVVAVGVLYPVVMAIIGVFARREIYGTNTLQALADSLTAIPYLYTPPYFPVTVLLALAGFIAGVLGLIRERLVARGPGFLTRLGTGILTAAIVGALLAPSGLPLTATIEDVAFRFAVVTLAWALVVFMFRGLVWTGRSIKSRLGGGGS